MVNNILYLIDKLFLVSFSGYSGSVGLGLCEMYLLSWFAPDKYSSSYVREHHRMHFEAGSIVGHVRVVNHVACEIVSSYFTVSTF